MAFKKIRNMKVYEQSSYQYKATPTIMLKGQWLINGSGNYYIEARTRSMGRTDLIIDFQGKQYIVEMKIWHGEEYNARGEEQLLGYLKDYNLKKAYMLSFNFNKKKDVGVKELHFKDATIVEAVV